VEPYIYVNTEGTDVTVYDVYSGGVVHTFASVAGRAKHMVVSSDGRALFVNDEANAQVVALDAETGVELRRYRWGTTFSRGLAYARPNAHPVLLLGAGRTYDVATGALYSNGISGESFDVDPANQVVYVQDTGSSPSRLRQYAISITALGDDPFVVRAGPESSGGSNGQDICTSADGARVYSANGAPYDFSVFQHERHGPSADTDCVGVSEQCRV
jgi:hypothetical protein